MPPMPMVGRLTNAAAPPSNECASNDRVAINKERIKSEGIMARSFRVLMRPLSGSAVS